MDIWGAVIVAVLVLAILAGIVIWRVRTGRRRPPSALWHDDTLRVGQPGAVDPNTAALRAEDRAMGWVRTKGT